MSTPNDATADSENGYVEWARRHFEQIVYTDLVRISIFEALLDSYRYIPHPKKYVFTKLIPGIVLGLIVLFIGLFINQHWLFRGPLIAAGVFFPLVLLFYPKIIHDRKAQQVTERFHLYITHLTVLSMTNIDRVEVFRQLAQIDDYKALSEESASIVALVDTWNQSLDDAALRRSKRAPGEILPPFLERLSYNIGAGQQMSDFLIEEQDVIMQRFTTRYHAALDKLEELSELYMSIMLSTTFAFVMAVLVPFLIGLDPMLLLSAIGTLAVLVQAGFVLLIHSKAPDDPLWVDQKPFSTRYSRRIIGSVIFGVILMLGVSYIVYLHITGRMVSRLSQLPIYLQIAVPTLPLLIPGMYISRLEGRVESCDSQFPAFIRSLGGIESIKQASTSRVLSSLVQKDFGQLTNPVLQLYRRLNIRINAHNAWQYFAAETGSYLIDKFSDVYKTGRQMGGDPKEIGLVISENYREVLKLREYRSQQVSSLLGRVYGMTAASTFAYIVGVEVMKILVETTQDIDLPPEVTGGFLSTQSYDITSITILVVVVILLHALLSAILVRLAARRHIGGATLHFTLLVWLAMGAATVTQYFMGGFLSF